MTGQIAGVLVQKLRHLELLLNAPWEVTVAPANGHPTSAPRRVYVPNAAAFLAQKILIHDRRDRADKAKDILYIHDTIETFGGNLPAIREAWERNVKPALHARASREIASAATTYFQAATDTIREAAQIATGRNLISGDGPRSMQLWMEGDVFLNGNVTKPDLFTFVAEIALQRPATSSDHL